MASTAQDIIKSEIQQFGFITIERFMQLALQATPNSYYRQQNPFSNTTNTNGDFITAPEISQIFGELIGLWVAQWWLDNTQLQLSLIELGPGRGLLMRDLLRATQHMTGFQQAINIDLIEINQKLLIIQQQNLSHVKNLIWHSDLNQLPTRPTIFIANEFFDALPVQQFIKLQLHWHEVVVKTDANKLYFAHEPITENIHIKLQQQYPQARDGAVVEISLIGQQYMHNIAKHLKKYGGAALIIDYGYNIKPTERLASQFNSTLQALKNHQFWPVLADIGTADLTTHVDFNNLQQLASQQGLTSQILSQRQFLLELGINLRLQILQNGQDTATQQLLANQVQRLINPSQMGELFKVLILTA